MGHSQIGFIYFHLAKKDVDSLTQCKASLVRFQHGILL